MSYVKKTRATSSCHNTGCADVEDSEVCPYCDLLIPWNQLEPHLDFCNKPLRRPFETRDSRAFQEHTKDAGGNLSLFGKPFKSSEGKISKVDSGNQSFLPKLKDAESGMGKCFEKEIVEKLSQISGQIEKHLKDQNKFNFDVIKQVSEVKSSLQQIGELLQETKQILVGGDHYDIFQRSDSVGKKKEGFSLNLDSFDEVEVNNLALEDLLSLVCTACGPNVSLVSPSGRIMNAPFGHIAGDLLTTINGFTYHPYISASYGVNFCNIELKIRPIEGPILCPGWRGLAFFLNANSKINSYKMFQLKFEVVNSEIELSTKVTLTRRPYRPIPVFLFFRPLQKVKGTDEPRSE